jgi:hypothetical protein
MSKDTHGLLGLRFTWPKPPHLEQSPENFQINRTLGFKFRVCLAGLLIGSDSGSSRGALPNVKSRGAGAGVVLDGSDSSEGASQGELCQTPLSK